MDICIRVSSQNVVMTRRTSSDDHYLRILISKVSSSLSSFQPVAIDDATFEGVLLSKRSLGSDAFFVPSNAIQCCVKHVCLVNSIAVLGEAKETFSRANGGLEEEHGLHPVEAVDWIRHRGWKTFSVGRQW